MTPDIPNLPPPARGSWTALIVAAAMVFSVAIAAAQQPGNFNPTDETPEDLPAGEGRDETFYTCTACHGFKLVSAQGMTRGQWDDSLDWMTKRHGMNKLEGDDRKLILDYLETHFPPSAPAGGRGAPNPFLK